MIEVNSASYTFASSGSAFTGVTTTGTWAWNSADSGRVQTTAVFGTKTLAVDTGFRSHKVIFTLGSNTFLDAAGGISLFCSGSSSSAANAVFLDINRSGSEYYVTLRAAGTNITKDSDGAQSYIAEYPFNPSDLASLIAGASSQFELSFGKYGWRARYYNQSIGAWITIAELPLYTPNNHSVSAGSQTRQYLRASTNTWAGVVVSTVFATAIADIQVYQVAEYGNTQSGSNAFFNDSFVRANQNPYLSVNNTVGAAYYTTGTGSANFSISSNRLVISNATRGNDTFLTYNTSGASINKFPSVANPYEYPTSMVKFTYYSGDIGLGVGGTFDISGAQWKTLWFNSSVSGSSKAVVWENQATFKDGDVNSPTFGATITTYDYPADSASYSLFTSGDVVWVVLYPTLSTTYPSDSATAYTIAVYKGATKPTIASTAIFTYTASDYFLYNMGLCTNTGAQVSSFAYYSESADVFTGVDTATPLVLLGDTTTLQVAPSTTSTELVGGVYLGTDYAYQITETT